MNLVSTKTGNSAIDELKNHPYSKIKEEKYVTSMLHISKRWVWPSTLTGIDGHVMSLNGHSAPTRYGWRRWARVCVNWDMPNGKVTTYANGIHDGTANVNPDTFSGPRKDVN